MGLCLDPGGSAVLRRGGGALDYGAWTPMSLRVWFRRAPLPRRQELHQGCVARFWGVARFWRRRQPRAVVRSRVRLGEARRRCRVKRVDRVCESPGTWIGPGLLSECCDRSCPVGLIDKVPADGNSVVQVLDKMRALL